ncbi:MAG: hypothetical protein GOV15_02790, partial [Candidatus Diapherotrites archaeon]|nr:hypothetical protein [Candidatus Diapherotrites archaeon]
NLYPHYFEILTAGHDPWKEEGATEKTVMTTAQLKLEAQKRQAEFQAALSHSLRSKKRVPAWKKHLQNVIDNPAEEAKFVEKAISALAGQKARNRKPGSVMRVIPNEQDTASAKAQVEAHLNDLKRKLGREDWKVHITNAIENPEQAGALFEKAFEARKQGVTDDQMAANEVFNEALNRFVERAVKEPDKMNVWMDFFAEHGGRLLKDHAFSPESNSDPESSARDAFKYAFSRKS